MVPRRKLGIDEPARYVAQNWEAQWPCWHLSSLMTLTRVAKDLGSPDKSPSFAPASDVLDDPANSAICSCASAIARRATAAGEKIISDQRSIDPSLACRRSKQC